MVADGRRPQPPDLPQGAVMIAALVIATALFAPAGEAPASQPSLGSEGPSRTDGAIAYLTRVADANQMGVTVTNFGLIGNRFTSRSPSMEYPLGTGFEHLVYGGLWIGARSVDASGAFTGVTTACLDIVWGSPPQQATEFTPSSDAIAIRSKLPSSPFYDPEAISEQDLLSDFDDLLPKTAEGSTEPHRPLGLRVRQESYAWSTGRLMHTLFLRFVIRSAGPPLSDLQVGVYTEFGSGQKNDYPVWPPSSGSPQGSWFAKAWLQYDDGLALLREHYCRAQPVPGGCDLAYVPYWVGLKLLTPLNAGQQRTLDAWTWAPMNTGRDQDVERYAILGAGTITDLTRPEVMPQTGDPVELFGIGPFPDLAPGDSVVVGFALLGGSDVADIQENARVAQRAWDSNFTDLPTPVQLARAAVDARPDQVTIAWQSPQPGLSCTVERAEPDRPWSELARLTADGTGRIEFEDRSVVAGARYGYRVVVEEAGAPVVLDELWVDVPGEVRLGIAGWSLDRAAGGRPRVSITLESDAPATLELFDPRGRRLHAHWIEGRGPGRHEVVLDTPRAVDSGVYFLRLIQEGRAATRRVVAIE